MEDWRTPFERLLYSDPHGWSNLDLAPLTCEELRLLCGVMGIPHTGSKDTLVFRLLDMADLRERLKDTPETAAMALQPGLHALMDALVAEYSGKELKQMCRRAKIWIGKCKRSSAASLLNWRNGCRTRGKKGLIKARLYLLIESHSRQVRFDFGKETGS